MGMEPLVRRAVSTSHGVGGTGWGVGLFCAFHTLRHSSCLVVRIREFLREVRSSCSELSINVHLGEVSELGGGEPCVLSIEKGAGKAADPSCPSLGSSLTGFLQKLL